MPRVFPIIGENVRRAIIDRFPLGVFFTIDDDRSTVIAVLHLHREPASWKRRL